MATGSVYSYFENKEKILYTILRNIWEKLAKELESLSNLPNLTPTEKIEGMIDLVFDVFRNKSRYGYCVCKRAST